MYKFEFSINNPEYYEKKKKTILRLLGKIEIKKLNQEIKKMTSEELFSEMIDNGSILEEFISLPNKSRKLFLLKYHSNERKYIIFNSYLFLQFLENAANEFDKQDTLAEEDKIENQVSNNKIILFYSTSISVLNKLKKNIFIPFTEENELIL